MSAAKFVILGFTSYAAVGLVFAVAFVTRGAARIDAAASGAPVAFRLLILPGSIALWPVLARKWWRKRT